MHALIFEYSNIGIDLRVAIVLYLADETCPVGHTSLRTGNSAVGDAEVSGVKTI
jgi:hypothetical protein